MYEDKKWYALAKEKYDKETFEHAKRVADYAMNHPLEYHFDEHDKEVLYQVALLHDIIEDTDFRFTFENVTMNGIDYETVRAVIILTNSGEKYTEYCERVRGSGNKFAYIAKLADMKDHLSLTDTLTDRLKEKYLRGLAVLL